MSTLIYEMGTVLALLLLFVWTIRKVGKRFNWQPEWQRKTLHVGLGLTALTFPWLFDQSWQVAILCVVGSLILLALREIPVLRRDLGRCLHDVQRASLGELYYAAAIGLLFWLAQGEWQRYVTPIAVLALADSSAALLGQRWGKRHFVVIDGTKSWEGVIAFVVVAFGIAVLTLAWLTSLSWLAIVLTAATLALLCALIEAIAWSGLDNLLIPLAGYLTLSALQGWDERLLLVQFCLLGGLILIASAHQSILSPHLLMLWTLSVYSLLIGGPQLWLLAMLLMLHAHYLVQKLWAEWTSDIMYLVPDDAQFEMRLC